MENIQSLTFNGNQVGSLTFNLRGTEYIYNPVPPPLDLKCIVADSSNNLVTSEQLRIMCNGNSMFFVKSLNNRDLSDVNISYPYASGYNTSIPSNKVRIHRIDNYGYLVWKNDGWNLWGGGSLGKDYDILFQFTVGDISFLYNMMGSLDENEQILLSGYYNNKVIKVPSCGVTNKAITFELYPMTFESILYDGNNALNQYIYGSDYSTRQDYNLNKSLSNTIFSALNAEVSLGSLSGQTTFSVKENTTSLFRENYYYLLVGGLYSGISGHVGVHFIQESHNENRIYVGYCPTKQYIDSNNNLSSPNEEYKFHELGSVIIRNSYQTAKLPRDYSVIYSSSVKNNYNITATSGSTNAERSVNYRWDNMNFYELQTSSDNTIITFNKK